MEKLMIVIGETKFTTLEKVLSVSDKKWEFKDLNAYCINNNMDYFDIEDYCDLVNNGYSGDASIDLSNAYISYCYVNI